MAEHFLASARHLAPSLPLSLDELLVPKRRSHEGIDDEAATRKLPRPTRPVQFGKCRPPLLLLLLLLFSVVAAYE